MVIRLRDCPWCGETDGTKVPGISEHLIIHPRARQKADKGQAHNIWAQHLKARTLGLIIRDDLANFDAMPERASARYFPCYRGARA